MSVCLMCIHKAECLNKNQMPSEVTVSIITRVTESQNHLGWKRPSRPCSPTSTQHHHHHTQAMIPTVRLLSYQHQGLYWVPAPGAPGAAELAPPQSCLTNHRYQRSCHCCGTGWRVATLMGGETTTAEEAGTTGSSSSSSILAKHTSNTSCSEIPAGIKGSCVPSPHQADWEQLFCIFRDKSHSI